MTITYISRKKICEAIAKEPTTRLNAGDFALSPSETGHVRSKSCSVCAVGAVMRSVLNPRLYASDIETSAVRTMRIEDPKKRSHYSGDIPPKKLLEKKQYMHALSSLFEREFIEKGICSMSGRQRARAVKQLKKDCIAFVQANFPARVALDIVEVNEDRY